RGVRDVGDPRAGGRDASAGAPGGGVFPVGSAALAAGPGGRGGRGGGVLPPGRDERFGPAGAGAGGAGRRSGPTGAGAHHAASLADARGTRRRGWPAAGGGGARCGTGLPRGALVASAWVCAGGPIERDGALDSYGHRPRRGGGGASGGRRGAPGPGCPAGARTARGVVGRNQLSGRGAGARAGRTFRTHASARAAVAGPIAGALRDVGCGAAAVARSAGASV